MKKLLLGFIGGVLLATTIPVSAEVTEVAYNKIKVFISGKLVEGDNVLIAGRTYVPLRAIGEGFGMAVNWDAATSTASIGAIPPTPKPVAEKNTIDTKEGFTIKVLSELPIGGSEKIYKLELYNYSDKPVTYDMNMFDADIGNNELYYMNQSGNKEYPYKLLEIGTIEPNQKIQGYAAFRRAGDNSSVRQFSYKEIFIRASAIPSSY